MLRAHIFPSTHEEAQRHPEAANDEAWPAHKALNEVQTWEGERHVDDSEDDGCNVAIAYASCDEDHGSIVLLVVSRVLLLTSARTHEKEVGAGQLLRSLQYNAKKVR